jgi:hypothetical protein
MRRYALILAVAAATWAATLSSAQAQWKAVDQPDLAQKVEQAPNLRTEDLGTPVTTVNRSALMRVPNADGKTVDLVQWYFRGYSGPTTAVIMDLGSGEVKTAQIPDNLQIHICGDAVGKDGKLYFATPWAYRAERKGMELFVYDPQTNEIASRGVVAPNLSGENRPMTLGTNGKIYGTGSYTERDQVGLYEIDTDTGKITDFGPIVAQRRLGQEHRRRRSVRVHLHGAPREASDRLQSRDERSQGAHDRREHGRRRRDVGHPAPVRLLRIRHEDPRNRRRAPGFLASQRRGPAEDRIRAEPALAGEPLGELPDQSGFVHRQCHA